MKVKTSELSGKALDWAVREVLLKTLRQPHLGLLVHQVGYGHAPDSYSTEWAQGGPIIEQEEICIFKGDAWCATNDTFGRFDFIYYGPTPLIAAMRCYVANKLGDEVDVPEELL